MPMKAMTLRLMAKVFLFAGGAMFSLRKEICLAGCMNTIASRAARNGLMFGLQGRSCKTIPELVYPRSKRHSTHGWKRLKKNVYSVRYAHACGSKEGSLSRFTARLKRLRKNSRLSEKMSFRSMLALSFRGATRRGIPMSFKGLWVSTDKASTQ